MNRHIRRLVPASMVFAVFALLLPWPAMALAGDASTTQPANQACTQPANEKLVAKLVARLAAERYPEREEATNVLISMGQAILPLVRAKLAEPDLDPEIAYRLNLVLRRLDLVEGMLAGRFEEVGWSGGASSAALQAATTYVKVTSIVWTDYALVARYDWKNGVMMLQQRGQMLAGPWVQDNDIGTFEFTFDKTGKFLRGRWNSVRSPEIWQDAFLR